MERLFVLAALVLGCASSPPDAGKSLTAEQKQELTSAERLFRSRSPEWPAARDRLAAQPGTSVWLARMLINYSVESYRVETPAGDDLLKELAGLERDTFLTRALREFRVLGASAVEPVYADLISSKLPENRTVGSLIMAAIGEPAVGALIAGARKENSRRGRDYAPVRAACIQTLAAFTARPEVVAVLRELAQDPEWEIRSEAVNSLGRAEDPESLRALAAVARNDADGFVRRRAITALAKHPSPEVVAVLVDSLDAAVRGKQLEDAKAAQAALRKAAGQDFGWDVGKWRTWLSAASRPATRPVRR